jgi:hypothetical protein
VLVVAPMVMASATRAGEYLQASCAAALVAVAGRHRGATPAAIMRRTASSTEVFAPPPSDMFATAGLTWFAVTQSIPAMTPLQVVPEPLQF